MIDAMGISESLCRSYSARCVLESEDPSREMEIGRRMDVGRPAPARPDAVPGAGQLVAMT